MTFLYHTLTEMGTKKSAGPSDQNLHFSGLAGQALEHDQEL